MSHDDVFNKGQEHWEGRYQQSSAEQWARRSGADAEVQAAVEEYRKRYGKEKARAVDIGAGDGRHTLYLVEQGFDVLSIDAAPTGIELIRQKLALKSQTAELLVADLREDVLPDNIDLLVAAYLIHLLPNPYQQVKTWQAKVRPGGICVMSTRRPFEHDPKEYWFAKDYELKQLFEDAGWSIIHAEELEVAAIKPE